MPSTIRDKKTKEKPSIVASQSVTDESSIADTEVSVQNSIVDTESPVLLLNYNSSWACLRIWTKLDQFSCAKLQSTANIKPQDRVVGLGVFFFFNIDNIQFIFTLVLEAVWTVFAETKKISLRNSSK